MELSRALSQRFGAVAVPANGAAGAAAVVALAGEDLVHEHPHLVDNDAKGGHLKQCRSAVKRPLQCGS